MTEWRGKSRPYLEAKDPGPFPGWRYVTVPELQQATETALSELDPAVFSYEVQHVDDKVTVYLVYRNQTAMYRFTVSPRDNDRGPLFRREYSSTVSEDELDFMWDLSDRIQKLARPNIVDQWPGLFPVATGAVAGQQDKPPQRRNRGPAPDVLKDCKEAMEYWLDQDKSLNMAAQLVGRDDQTVLKWIPNVLDTMPSDRRAAWIAKIRAQRKDKYLGVHGSVGAELKRIMQELNLTPTDIASDPVLAALFDMAGVPLDMSDDDGSEVEHDSA